MKRILIGAVLAMFVAAPLLAHCDSVKGPVALAAQQALEKRDVTPVLKWVPAANEKEIRDAFAKTLAVRAESPQAREVADRWFLETLVRVHRQSEGAPYTGIKGAEVKPEEGIELADQAIESGTLADVEKEILQSVSIGLKKRFAHVVEAKRHANESVEAGREYVHAYVEFIHYVERLHESATTPAGHHATEAHVAEKH